MPETDEVTTPSFSRSNGKSVRVSRKRSSAPASINYGEDQRPDIAIALGISELDWTLLGEQARRIITELLPEWVDRFVRANQHYGGSNANRLGPAGQFADIWRKIGPLERALWHGEELTREPPDVICMDLVGHSLLTVDMLRQGVPRRGSR